MKIFHWKVRVYYEDTDAGGVVYYARYLAFYERARTEMLRLFDIEQKKLLEQQIAFVVSKINVDYLSPAYLDETLVLETHINRVKKVSIALSQVIKNTSGTVINRADVIIACVDIKKMKPVSFPQQLLEKIL